MFHGPGQPITIERSAEPECGPHDVIVAVRRCGICGSDISMTGEAIYTFPPGPIGHEYAGEIVEVGREVAGIRVGQHVACKPGTACGECQGCRWGNPTFCVNPQRTIGGQGGSGGFGEFVALPAGGAFAMPEGMSFADGALVEPMACGVHALRLAQMPKGARVLIVGAGSMALAMVFWARRLGAGRIAVLSRSDRRRDIAMALGADAVFSLAQSDPAQIAEALGGPADIVAECVGKPGMLAKAAEYLRPRGTLLSLGMCMHNEPVIPALLNFKEASLIFPVAYTAEEFAETVRALDAGQADPALMVSDVIPLETLPETIEQMRSGHNSSLKVQVDPSMGEF